VVAGGSVVVFAGPSTRGELSVEPSLGRAPDPGRAAAVSALLKARLPLEPGSD